MEKRELARLGEILVDYEKLMETLYRKYADRFPLLSEVWAELAEEEAGHAKAMEKVRFGLMDGRVQVKPLPQGLRGIEEQYEMLREMINGNTAARTHRTSRVCNASTSE